MKKIKAKSKEKVIPVRIKRGPKINKLAPKPETPPMVEPIVSPLPVNLDISKHPDSEPDVLKGKSDSNPDYVPQGW